ncbi:uncharacterized protein LOC113273333 [Papaver somniferum]|uniref:uncharacterized protein LOC113273333 n=1 Tax=Papaver somniferum TaxID=3469 RepID=UPI000E7036E8|nr:uncharacterized protein LOC113273333 [Papaver somniferum]
MRDLHKVFTDLEKAYDRVQREVLWWMLKKKRVLPKYINLIKDMYEGDVTGVWTCDGVSSDFLIKIGQHQGSTLSPYLFALVMDQLTRWRLQCWRQTLESKGFRLSRTKTEYLRCDFDDPRPNVGDVLLDRQLVPKKDSFKYLGSIIQSDGGIEEDIRHQTQEGWEKWILDKGDLCDRKFPLKLKGEFYKTTIRPMILYGTECWVTKDQDTRQLCTTEMHMLRWVCGHRRHDHIRNEYVRKKMKVVTLKDMLTQHQLRWFGHIRRRPHDAPVRIEHILRAEGQIKRRGGPKLTWDEWVKRDLEKHNLTEEDALDRRKWRAATRMKEVGFLFPV